MAKFNIISKDGASVRYTGCPRYSGSYMGVGVLEFSEISSPSPINWEIGDFVDYRNGRYRLYSLPEPRKQARRNEYGAAFVYTGVQFHSPVKDLEIALFRDIVAEDNEVHFSTLPDVSTYEDVYGIARRIQACMDDMYPGKWRIEVYQSDDDDLNALLAETKAFSLSGGTCLDALSLIYETWKNVGWVHTTEGGKEVITIARANVRDDSNTTDTFAYGKGKGLTAIRRASANKDEFATRLYIYGSERNLPPRYYNSKDIKDAASVRIPNLMLPIGTWGKTDGLPDARLAYIEADESIIRKYGLIPRVVRFDGSEREEIYPSIEGLTQAEVRQAIIALGQNDKYIPGDNDTRIDEVVDAFVPDDYGNIANPDGTTRTDTLDTTFTLEVHTFGFDIDAQAALAGESSARISMKTGKCAGREFAIKGAKWDGGTWVLTMERQSDDSLNMLFPNNDYLIAQGDRFVLLDIAMPEYYITLAQERLYEEGMKVLTDYTRTSAYYEPQIDAKVMHENAVVIREGMYMEVDDEDVVETSDRIDYVIIDTLTIDEKTEIPTYNVTLREHKRAARGMAALEVMIEDAKETSSKVLEEAKQYSKRSFSSALQTIEMLKEAFKDFSEGIDPVTVQTMALLVGDESLQFKFIGAVTSGVSVNPGFGFDASTKQFKVNRSARLMHMTLGINDVTSKDGRSMDDYLKWSMPSWASEVLDEPTTSYYLYARVPKDGTSGVYLLSESAIDMDSEEGYYHLLVGILNSEYNGEREFVTLYGFTEVLPGRISTSLIRSTDGETYFDLEKGEIGGAIKFKAGTEGLENVSGLTDAIDEQISEIEVSSYNLLRNSGFNGNFTSIALSGDISLSGEEALFSNPLYYWKHEGAKVIDCTESASQKACQIENGGYISQRLDNIIIGETYIISFKAIGTHVDFTLGGISKSIILNDEWGKYVAKITATENNPEFVLRSDNCTIYELQVERGNVVSNWGTNINDNNSEWAKIDTFEYLKRAISKGSTDILGGLIMSNLLLLGDPIKGGTSSGVSGIYDNDSDVAFWAGGTFEQAIATAIRYQEDPTYVPTEEELSSMANLVLTHGGKAILNNGIFRGSIHATSGYFGDFKIDGLFAKSSHTDSHGCKFGDGLYESWFSERRASMNAMGYSDLDDGRTIDHGFWSNVGYFSDPTKGEHKFSFYAKSGMIAGMRPNLRVVMDAGSSSSPNKILKDDHTIIFTSDEVNYFELPAIPEDGSVIELIGIYGGKLSIGGGSIFDMDAGIEVDRWTSPNNTNRRMVRMVFSLEIGMWILTEEQYGT